MSTKAIEIQQQDRKRKQIIVLAVGGVLLLLVMALQLPRLRGGESEPASAESATATADGAAATTTAPASSGDPGTTATTPPITTTVVPSGKPLGTAYYAGVVVPGGFAVQPSEGNLLSFSLLRAKDPFVQQVDDTPAEVVTDGGTSDGVAAATPAPTPAQPEPTPTTAPEAPAVATPVEPADVAPPTATTGPPSGTVEVKPEPPVPTFATVNVNGKPAATTVKQPFPAPQNLFVVTKLTDTTAQLGIAGAGSFSGGRKTITLTMGEPVTLVDRATGVRYALELVYTGTSPEQIEGFTAQAPATQATPADEATAANK